MNKNAFSRMMIDQYYVEKAIAEMENADMAVDTTAIDLTETDPLWDCWYDLSFLYEPECTKDNVQKTVTKSMDESDDVDDLFYDEPVYEPNSKDKTRERVSKRRKNAAKHKRKFGKTAGIVWETYSDRATVDMQNHSFQKRKNGERIDVPKCQETKADRILKQAIKTNVVPENLRDEIAKHLEKTRSSMSDSMENKIYYERYCQMREKKVKQELEDMAA